MKSAIFLAGAIALFAGMTSANLHPAIARGWRCSDQMKKAGIKCKRGDTIHIKRDDDGSNKFHVAVQDENGNEIDLPEVDIAAFNEAEI